MGQVQPPKQGNQGGHAHPSLWELLLLLLLLPLLLLLLPPTCLHGPPRCAGPPYSSSAGGGAQQLSHVLRPAVSPATCSGP